ncbi:MAG: hypothetical protein K0S74_656 [Chlamydiales bacterium]|jgi:multidrug resistance efflux pump|nr:hypothetical protein [Chlamydiales bacterium]
MITANSDKVSAVQLLAIINQLSLQAYRSQSLEALIFQIVNDTYHAISYNRAMLWKYEDKQFVLLGISGQTQISKKSPLIDQTQLLMSHLKELEKPQILSKDSFKEQVHTIWHKLSADSLQPEICWFPIIQDKQLIGGLWLERWHKEEWLNYELEMLGFITAAYAAAWDKYRNKFNWKKVFRFWGFYLGIMLLGSFIIHVPLRIVAPCEVVSKDPVAISATLDGTIAQLEVKPGQLVKKGDLLYSYNPEIPLQNLKSFRKQVEVSQAELDRAVSLAFTHNRGLAEIEELSLRLRKEKIALETAEYQAKHLQGFAPKDGIVMLDDPEKWRGSPVTIGEKILQIADPSETKVRMWIPESDNIVLNQNKPIKVFLNVSPNRSFTAQLKYIASYTHVNDKGMPCFTSEANWIEEEENLKLGLKGSAILYGEDVSLFYWLVRRPWTALRNFIGF